MEGDGPVQWGPGNTAVGTHLVVAQEDCLVQVRNSKFVTDLTFLVFAKKRTVGIIKRKWEFVIVSEAIPSHWHIT